MPAIKVLSFGAMLPAVESTLLPQNNAEIAENVWVYSGALEGMPEAIRVHTLTDTDAGRAFRIPFSLNGKDNIPDSDWLELASSDTDVVTSPIAGDTFGRIYWAAPDIEPQYNTTARIIAGDPPFKLGIPAPSTAPGVSVAGGAVPAETRAYVYTWVSAYGEESAPSPPTLFTGNASGTWNLTFTAPGGSVTTNRNLTHTRIYRTITGTSGSTAYYLVAEIAIATLAYADTVPTTTVAANTLLQSLFWNPPPTDLEGITAMPNGIIAGFRGNEVYFCEPYRPHAWPATYALSLDSDIVGLGTINQSLVVCTRVSPYVITGVNPATMSVSKLAVIEPCLSRGSIVSTPAGVVYASQNGLVLAAPGRAQVITQQVITKDLWLDDQNYANINRLRAALLGTTYYAWGSQSSETIFEDTAFEETAFQFEDLTGALAGLIIDTNDPRIGYTKLVTDTTYRNCWRDEWTGEILLAQGDGVFWLDLARSRTRQPYRWRSKAFEAPNQRNFAAMRIYFDTYHDTPEPPTTPNIALEQELTPDQWGLARVYCDGVLRFTREMRASGELMRLPSGFKATYWQVEIEARVRVKSIELATTAKELGSV
jgi:hypothetical protein